MSDLEIEVPLCRFLLFVRFKGERKGFNVLRSKTLSRYFFVFFPLIGCVLLTLGAAHPAFAQHATPTSVIATDFHVPSGSDPWGTTFDSHGNVWLAAPGCDPTPACSTNTPPGKIEVFNRSSSSWTQTLQLPSGYAQALFLAFDTHGRLCSPRQ